MGEDVEERSVTVSPAVVVNEVEFVSVEVETVPLPERLDRRCALQRGDLNAAMLIDPRAGDRRVASSAGSVY